MTPSMYFHSQINKKNARKLKEETFTTVFLLVVAQLVKNLPAMWETLV